MRLRTLGLIVILALGILVAPLSTAEVSALLRSLGFSATAEDLAEVTHRLNAFASALAPLAALDLERAALPGAALDLGPP